jgi:P27 family predicted phage terminase small subunit
MPRTVRKDSNLQPGKPAKPEHLSALASKEWDRLTSELETASIQVTTAHRALLSIAATLSADIRQAWETVKREGQYITNKKTGAVQEHPASKKLDALRRDLLKALVTLGMRATPAPPPNEGPTLEDVLNA